MIFPIVKFERSYPYAKKEPLNLLKICYPHIFCCPGPENSAKLQFKDSL
jgi:hypothetical protein